MSKLVISKSETPHASITAVAEKRKEVGVLLDRTEAEQRRVGYFHTLREILQQPATWRQTGEAIILLFDRLRESVAGIETLVLTGSGSSEFAGECLRLPLQTALCTPVQTIGGGTLLTHGGKAIGPGRPGLMVSLARSGDSPESVGAVECILESEPRIRHLVVTCNAEGRLATTYRHHDKVTVVVLAAETNDSSLVMTSSFTNMVLAGAALGSLNAPDSYWATIEALCTKADDILQNHIDTIAGLARRGFNRVVYLASGARLGAAHEAALKMTEMTAGRVTATSDTYLGLRHGPMSGVLPDTLVVCFLSSDPLVRAYECDLIRELNDKQLGMAKFIFGDQVPTDLILSGDVVIDCKGLASIGDDNVPVLDAVVGQLIAFFRCLEDGLQPDSPSREGIINRVVQEFKLHRPEE